jgi:hypothetical protein
MSDSLFGNLVNIWKGSGDRHHSRTHDATALTPYQTAEMALKKTEEANKLTLQKQKLEETALYHREAEMDRKYKIAAEMQKRMIDWDDKREAARLKWLGQYETAQKAALDAWEKESGNLAKDAKAQQKAFKEMQNAYAVFIPLAERIGDRKYSVPQLKNLLNMLDAQNRQNNFHGLRPAMQYKVAEMVKAYNEMSPEERKKNVEEARKAADGMGSIANGEAAASPDQVEALQKTMDRERPKTLSEDPNAGLQYAQQMSGREYGDNPYRTYVGNYWEGLRKGSGTSAIDTAKPLQIGGYMSSGKGVNILPAYDASDADKELINKYNQSQEARSTKNTGNLTNEMMAERLQKFINKDSNGR